MKRDQILPMPVDTQPVSEKSDLANAVITRQSALKTPQQPCPSDIRGSRVSGTTTTTLLLIIFCPSTKGKSPCTGNIQVSSVSFPESKSFMHSDGETRKYSGFDPNPSF